MKFPDNRLIIERLTALWALNECGLGGFMHAVSSPFTGIFVGGVSIMLISLIALHADRRWSVILKSLTLVLLVKLAVSPHSPITSYFAVSFQAFAGMFLFSIFSINRFSVILLGMITFLESATQKLLTMTLIYGESLWAAVDIYSNWVSEKISFLAPVLSSRGLIVSFLLFYTFSGLIVGLLINKVIGLVRTAEFSNIPSVDRITEENGRVDRPKSRHYRKRKVLVFWLVAVVIISLPLILINENSEGWKSGIYLVSRSILVLLFWYLLIGPLLLKAIRLLLEKRQSKFQSQIEHTLDLFPYLRSIINLAWSESASEKGLSRMSYFLAKTIVYSVHFNSSEE